MRNSRQTGALAIRFHNRAGPKYREKKQSAISTPLLWGTTCAPVASSTPRPRTSRANSNSTGWMKSGSFASRPMGRQCSAPRSPGPRGTRALRNCGKSDARGRAARTGGAGIHRRGSTATLIEPVAGLEDTDHVGGFMSLRGRPPRSCPEAASADRLQLFHMPALWRALGVRATTCSRGLAWRQRTPRVDAGYARFLLRSESGTTSCARTSRQAGRRPSAETCRFPDKS